jgi:hypothetical protein
MREALLDRKWRQRRGRFAQRHLIQHESDPGADLIGAGALLTLVLVVPLDLSLFGIAWQPAIAGRWAALPGWPLACAFAVVALAGAWRVDLQLARWTPGSTACRPGVRVLRAVLLGLPIVSFAAVPLWSRAQEIWPQQIEPWFRKPREERFSLQAPPRPIRRRPIPPRLEAAFVGMPGAVVWYLLEIATTGAITFWLAGAAAPPTARRAAMLTVAGTMHVAATILLAVAARVRSRRRRFEAGRSILVAWLPVFGLAPVPVSLIPIVVALFVDSARSEALVWTAFIAFNQAERTSTGWNLRRSLHRRREAAGWRERWTDLAGEVRQRNVGELDLRLRELIYGKAALCLADGLIVGGGVQTLGGGLGTNPQGIVRWLDPLVAVPLLAAAAGLALGAAGALGTVLRVPACVRVARSPWADSLVWPGWGFGLGALAGRLVAGGAVRGGLTLIVIGSPLPIFYSAILFMLRPLTTAGRPRLREILWLGSPLVCALVAAAALRPEPWLRLLALSLLLATPVWHLLLALTLGRWLLWPWGVRDLMAPRLPSPLRRLLLVLAITVAIPGGGLAAPLWVRLRRRLGSGAPPRSAKAVGTARTGDRGEPR